MKKKFISIAKKAMVWTMAASMVIGTPMTASARGLSDVFKIEDQWGKEVLVDGQHSGDESRTGTVTNTNTNTESGVLHFDTQIGGIVLSETNLEIVTPSEAKTDEEKKAEKEARTLTASLVDKAGNPIETGEIVDELNKRFTWKTSEKNGTSVVTLRNNNKAAGKTNEMEIVPVAGGRTTVTVSLDDYKYGIHYSATANIYVKRYATKLWFVQAELDKETYAGESLDLNDYIHKDPEDASDTITYAIVEGKDATLKGSVLTLKKVKNESTVKVVAMGEKASTEAQTINIKIGVPATKVVFEKVAGGNTKYQVDSKGTSYSWLVNDETNKEALTFGAVLTGKNPDKNATEKEITSTDKIASWTSKKPDIVEVKTPVNKEDGRKDNQLQVELIARKVGTAQIVAKTSTGKTGTLKVTVKAGLTGLEIETVENTTVYSGQTYDLKVKQLFGDATPNFTDAGVKWEFVSEEGQDKKNMGKVAKLKGATLTVNPDITKTVTKLDEIPALKIMVYNSKKIVDGGKQGDAAKSIFGKVESTNKEYVSIQLEQVNISDIFVFPNAASVEDSAAESAALVYSKGNNDKPFNDTTSKTETVTIAVDDERTFGIKAMAVYQAEGEETPTKHATLPDGKTPAAAALSWTSGNVKLATVSRTNTTGSVKAIKKGSPAITLSGATLNTNSKKHVALKATVKLNITQPTKNITLSTKYDVIPAVDQKAASVTIKAILDKGTTSKANQIKWTVTRKNSDGEVVYRNYPIKGGKLTINNKTGLGDTQDKNKEFYTSLDYAFGDTFTVKATLADAGISTSKTFTVVRKSNKAKLDTVTEIDPETGEPVTGDPVANKGELFVGRTYNLKALIESEKEDNQAKVTYTVSKPGYVFIVGDLMVPLAEFKGIKITPVTADGKTGTAMTFDIKSKKPTEPGNDAK